MRFFRYRLRRARALIRRAGRRLGALCVAHVPGQGLTEYGLILVLVMVVCVAILAGVGSTLSTVWYEKLINNGPF